MTVELGGVLDAMAGGSSEPVGWFTYDLGSDTWTWSPALYLIHGFQPGEIVPTTAVLVSHKHPEDRAHTDEVLTGVLATGQPFSCRHRIITSSRETRTVISIGQGTLDDLGRVTSLHGYFVDISDAATQASRQEIQDAVDLSAAARAEIEQAKGALMVVQGVSADDAFAILRWHSSHANVKLRDLAIMIVDGISQPLQPGDSANQRITRLLAGVVDGIVPRQAVRSPPSQRSAT